MLDVSVMTQHQCKLLLSNIAHLLSNLCHVIGDDDTRLSFSDDYIKVRQTFFTRSSCFPSVCMSFHPPTEKHVDLR